MFVLYPLSHVFVSMCMCTLLHHSLPHLLCLTFLLSSLTQGSVPHLRLHLQLQQTVLKQLVEKRVNQQQQSPIHPAPQQPQQQLVELPQHSKPAPVSTVSTSQSQSASLLVPSTTQSTAQQQSQVDVAAALAKLPEDQRKYIEQLRLQKQSLLQVAMLQQKRGGTTLVNGPTHQGASSSTANPLQPFSVLYKQQQRVKEQQQQATQALGLQAAAGQIHLSNLPAASSQGASSRGVDIRVTQAGPSGMSKTFSLVKGKGFGRENSQSPLPPGAKGE